MPKDFASAESGAMVVMASCCDERFPPDNVIDGRDSTFWMTTGMFPQELVIKLESAQQISKITTMTLNGGWSTCAGSLLPAHAAMCAAHSRL